MILRWMGVCSVPINSPGGTIGPFKMALLDTLKQKFPSLANTNLGNKNYEVRAQQQPRRVMLLILRKMFFQLVLMPFYLILVIPLMVVGLFNVLFFVERKQFQYLKKYCDAFWYFPSLCIHKSIEGTFCSTFPLVAPATDIGCEDGRVSQLLFNGYQFDLGVEYIKENLPRTDIYKRVIQGGLPQLPAEMAGQFQSVSFIHVIDHIQDLKGALRGLKKVLKGPGATIALSGFARGYQESLKWVTLGIFNKRRLNQRYGFWHFHSVAQWKKIFEEEGFQVNRIAGFLSGLRGTLWTLLHTVFEINGSNELYYVINKLNIVPLPLKRIFFIFPVVCVVSLFHSTKLKDKGCHFYAEISMTS
jgi:hypothetical protein